VPLRVVRIVTAAADASGCPGASATPASGFADASGVAGRQIEAHGLAGVWTAVDATGAWHRLPGVSGDAAVLVRPDAHVAWVGRLPAGKQVDDGAQFAALAAAVERVLCLVNGLGTVRSTGGGLECADR
jgi:hypothetical protein